MDCTTNIFNADDFLRMFHCIQVSYEAWLSSFYLHKIKKLYGSYVAFLENERGKKTLVVYVSLIFSGLGS